MLANYLAFAKEIYVGNFTFAWCVYVSVFHSVKSLTSVFLFFIFEAQFFHLLS